MRGPDPSCPRGGRGSAFGGWTCGSPSVIRGVERHVAERCAPTYRRLEVQPRPKRVHRADESPKTSTSEQPPSRVEAPASVRNTLDLLHREPTGPTRHLPDFGIFRGWEGSSTTGTGQ